MATRKVARKQVKDYRKQLVADLKQKYDCASCGFALSGELQLWPSIKTCIGIKVDEPTTDNYEDIFSDACKIIDSELISLGLKKIENEKEVLE